MTLKEALEAYLTEQAEKDPAFAGKFDAGKMNACVTYVTNQARTYLQGKNGAVEHTTVYKWARDFFNDGESEKAETDAPETNSPDENEVEAPETPAEPKAKSWEEAKREMAEKKAKKKKPAPKSEDDDGMQLCFDFGE